MKKIGAYVLLLITSCALFAGDVAVFSDIGFSEDGKTYIFGQYGKTDKLYEAWAEIYTVDVEKNDFVKGKVFKTNPSKSTVAFSGKAAYESLKSKASSTIANYRYSPAKATNLLYVRENDSKPSTDEIVFRDYSATSEEYYHIRLVPSYSGSGKNVQSKFYISFKKCSKDGSELFNRTVGTPDFLRKGITNYRIDRIFTDDSGKSIVFIIEKTLQDETGISIRYMVETVRL